MMNIRSTYIIPALFLLFMILGFGLNAHSEDVGANADANASFKSFITLKRYMDSQGIDSTKVNWKKIDSMCLGLKTAADEVPYNKCAYKKARDSVLHKADKSQCSIRAIASYPDSFKTVRKDTLTETDKDGQVHTFERTTAPLSVTELEQRRLGTTVECMQSLGWVSADDWTLGKNTVCP